MDKAISSLIDRSGLDRDRVGQLIKRGLEGADDGELFLEYRQSEALMFDNGRLKQATYDTAQGFGLRAVKDEAVGPAGPTTATRMDKFTELMLGKTGLIAMIGKSERGPEAIKVIKKYQRAYLMAVGGAAYLVSKAIKASRVVAFADLGMEAIYEFDVKDMPVTVAVDSNGTSVHETGPAEWQQRIGKIPVRVV